VRIEEFHIVRYGHIRVDKPYVLSDFTLFWGKNERGKTLTIDALVKLLLGRESKRFTRIDRVDEKPSGYVVVGVGADRFKLPEKGALTDVCEVSEAECRNIFIVRASDLSIEREGREKEKDREKEALFYAAVTDRLTGLKTKQIAEIKRALRDLGKLTPKGDDIRDTQAEPIKSRLRRARELIERIGELTETIGRERLDEVEERLVALREQKLLIGHELEGYESARRRELYEKARAAYDQLTVSLTKLRELENITEEDERARTEAERDLKNLSESKARAAEKLAALEKRRDDLSDETTKKKRDMELLSDKKKRIDDELVPELNDYKMRSGEAARRSGNRRFYTIWTLSSAAVLSGALFGLAVGPSSLWYTVAAISGVSFFAALLSLFFASRQEAWLSGMSRRIAVTASKYGLGAPSVEGLFGKIQRFLDEYRLAEAEFNRLAATREALEGEIAKTAHREIPEIDGKIAEAQRIIDAIRAKTGQETLASLRGILRGKREYEESRGRQAALLRSLFGDRNVSLREYLPLWKKDIDALSSFKDARTDLAYDDAAVSALKEKRGTVEGSIEETNDSLSRFRKDLSAVEREADEVFGETAERTPVETSADLTLLRRRLETLVAGIEADRESARTALSLFDAIETEEREQVSLLFGQQSPVSSYFSQVTGGLYDTVVFDHESSTVLVRSRDGEELSVDKLSSGAYDQLYLAVRMALGERLLGDGAGFFIMDDPFIRSDPERLGRQLAMLVDVTEKGWQIIYFSSKGEVREALAKEIKKGAVTLIEL
jgi:exonuclease SbcC